jgi:hypothetical protein
VVDKVSKPSWLFPALDRRIGADPTWASTLDTLRAPRPKSTKLWDWRKESPVRPILFQDSGTLDASTVHVHLEHRLVQRLLGRFKAQGFLHDDLARACVLETGDAIRRVLILGRLSLYGHGAARLHDEILAVTARWSEPEQRAERLKPYAVETEHKTLSLLDEALRDRAGRAVAEALRDRLKHCAARDVQELLPHLEARAEAAAEKARGLLSTRGEREASDMASILQTQRRAILSQRGKHVDPSTGAVQLLLGFPEAERRQVEADVRFWSQRLGDLEVEMQTEPERIRRGYEVKVWRVEPLGVVYLWPRSG